MFKKSLAAVAVLGAFAASSFAADVTFYGKVDMGLQYQNAETTGFDGKKDTVEDLKLDSGVGLASRIGIKATEDLGNGDKVAFNLEGDFNADDGELAAENHLWQREASLSYIADWGTLYAGRYGSFSGAAGSTDIVMSRVDVFDGGHKSVGLLSLGRMDNAISYLSPKIAGFQAAAMYSFKNDSDETIGTKSVKTIEKALNATEFKKVLNTTESTFASHEGHADANRYAGFAMTYDVGALQTAISYEQLIRSDAVGNKSVEFDQAGFLAGAWGDTFTETTTDYGQALNDAKIVTFGASYDFDMFKLFGAAQYFEGMDKVANSKDAKVTFNEDGIEGYGLHLGTEFQALAGNFEFGMYYIDATANGVKDRDGEYFGLNGRYIYKLSKRTELRSSIAYDHTEWEKLGEAQDWEKDRYLACVSLTHNF